jgi:hypothetical protein
MLALLYAKFLDHKNSIINAIGFQLVWFICVQGNDLNAAVAVIALLVVYLMMFRTEFKVLMGLTVFSLIGYLGDGIIAMLFQLDYLGSLDYNDNLNFLAPLWLLGLWLGFATTMNHSMQWLFKTPYLTIFIALFLVPISYFAGITLSGSTFSTSIAPLSAGSMPNELFFVTEGIWWAVLLTGYKKLSAPNPTIAVKHV